MIAPQTGVHFVGAISLDSVKVRHHFFLRKGREVINIELALQKCRTRMRGNQEVVQGGSNGEF